MTALGAYVLSAVVGCVFVAACMHGMRWTMNLHRKNPDGSQRRWLEWLDLYVGGTERLVATTLVILAPSYLPAFIGGWIVLKLASNWQRLPGEDSEIRKGHMLALIGSVLSFSVAIACGLLVNPDALQTWKK